MSYTSYPSYAPPIHIGHQNFGKASVGCKLLGSRNRWGILNDASGQTLKVGVLFFEFTFWQPDKYSLRHATILMDFDSPDSQVSSCGPIVGLHVPSDLAGPVIQRDEEIEAEGSLEGEGAGFGAKLARFLWKTSTIFEDKWTFSGRLGPTHNAVGEYTAIEWKWEDPKPRARSTERPVAGAAVLHLRGDPQPQPFEVRLQFVGKLKTKSNLFGQFKFRTVPESIRRISPLQSTQDLAAEVARINSDIDDMNKKHAAIAVENMREATEAAQASTTSTYPAASLTTTSDPGHASAVPPTASSATTIGQGPLGVPAAAASLIPLSTADPSTMPATSTSTSTTAIAPMNKPTSSPIPDPLSAPASIPIPSSNVSVSNPTVTTSPSTASVSFK